ncbi:hypothetical protein JXM67_15245 [candidate division WOR-3 bacterium]|nr:hypothetical protein [candidate division WOR-3 bacterium]
MKTRIAAAIAAVLAFSSLQASYNPDAPARAYDYIDTVKAVFVYALGEWNNSSHTYHHGQNTPLPGYAFEICDKNALPPTIPDYYKKCSQGRFIVNAECWGRQNTYCYVMEGLWTPMSPFDQGNGPFFTGLINRLDAEAEHVFTQSAMYYPDNDHPDENDTPFVWLFIISPEVDGSWGVGGSDATYRTNQTMPNGDTIFVNLFGYSRNYSTKKGDIVAGVVHEFNHEWLPDIGYNADHYGLGGFEPQAIGCGFRNEQEGGLPSPINPVWRAQMGWIDRIWVYPSKNLFNQVIQDQTAGEVYVLNKEESGTDRDLFYLSCHMRQSFYERLWPGRGLLIWHDCKGDWGGDEWGPPGRGRMSKLDSLDYLRKPQDLECAHGCFKWNRTNDAVDLNTPDPVRGRDHLDMRPQNYYPGSGNKGDAECFFWPDFGYTQFDGLTNPSSREQYGYKSGIVDTFGSILPPRAAVRNIQQYGIDAMKADLLYKYCLAGSEPNMSMALGGNNQRNVCYLEGETETRIMLVYTLSGRVAFSTMFKGESATLDLQDLVDAKRHLSLSNSGAGYPALQIGPARTVHLCWLEGEAPDHGLWYRRGVMSGSVPDEVDWTGSLNAKANLSDSASYGTAYFTPPAIEISGGTVFVATGIHRNTYLESGGGGPPLIDSLPVLCFRFPVGNPRPSAIVTDTIGWYHVPAVQGDVGGATVSLARDDQGRVHAVFLAPNAFAGHTYFEDGEWNNVITIGANPGGQFASVSPPCIVYCDGILYAVASALHQTLAPDHTDIFISSVNLSGPVPGLWEYPANLSNTPESNSTQPVVEKHYTPHVFWSEEGEIMCRHSGENITVSHTPHSTSTVPHVISGDGKYHLAWLESNQFGDEINLRSLSFSGGGAFGEGGQSRLGIIKPDVMELSASPFAISKLSICYTLPLDAEDAELNIYDCQGRLVRKWSLETVNGAIEWDGSDTQGGKLGSGVYFIRLACGEAQKVNKVLLIK